MKTRIQCYKKNNTFNYNEYINNIDIIHDVINKLESYNIFC